MVVIGQEKEEDARRSGKAPGYFLLAESVLRWTKRHSTTSKQKKVSLHIILLLLLLYLQQFIAYRNK